MNDINDMNDVSILQLKQITTKYEDKSPIVSSNFEEDV